jgi:putative Mg2+ transporter-C (MgtC) family protein
VSRRCVRPSLREAPIPAPHFPNEFVEDLARLGAAVLIGGIVGLNRELRRKPAGLRTHALVAIGSAVAMLSSVRIAEDYGTAAGEAVTRTVQGIIVGIGFLGGGVIVKTGHAGRVHNLTTAASIWVVACLGIVCGAGQWVLALGALVLTLVVLLLGGPAERMLRRVLNPGGDEGDPDEPRSKGGTGQ